MITNILHILNIYDYLVTKENIFTYTNFVLNLN